MAKKDKKTGKTNIPPAPETTQDNKVVEPEVINNGQTPVVTDLDAFIASVGKASQEGLDPNRRVDLLKIMHETFRMDPDAAKKYNMSQEIVSKINHATAIGQVAALACEAAFGKNPFAISLSKSQLLTLIEVGETIGVTFNQNALPAPKEDGTIEVPSTAIQVSKETEKQLKEEEELKAAKPTVDPTKIESEEDLEKALNFIMVDRANAYQKLADAINFYRAYLDFKASKSENKDEELKKNAAKNNVDLLKEIRTFIKKSPIVINGIGRSMATFTASSKSPVPAFCILRNSTKNKNTGVPAITDQEVADFARVLVEWAVENQITEQEAKIAACQKDIETLSKDKKANANGIKDCEEKIETYKKNIERFHETISCMSEPSFDVVDNLLTNFNEKDTIARRIFNYVEDSYYSDVDTKTVDAATFKHNIQQYAGVITNMFRDTSTQNLEYAEANIVDLSETQEDSKKA